MTMQRILLIEALIFAVFIFRLVFSQSLLSLDLIEDFLDHWDTCHSQKDEEQQDEKNKVG